MSDVENLFLILAILYFGECAVWIRPGAFVVSAQIASWFRIANLGRSLLRNYDGGLLVGNLFPLGETFLCEQWPLSISPDGIYAYVSQAPSSDGRPLATERFISFRSLKKIEFQDSRVFLNGVLFARFATPAFARVMAGLLVQLLAAEPADRAPLIQIAVRKHLNVAEVHERRLRFRRCTRDLRLTNIAMVFLTLVYPVIVAWLDPFVLMNPLLFGYLLLHILALAQFWFAHGALYPGQWKDRLKHSLLVLISPADAMHGRDKLARPLLADIHPLVVAKTLCSDEVFRELAVEALRDIRHPMLPVCPIDDPAPSAVEAWFRDLFHREFEGFLRDAGIALTSADSVPSPVNDRVRSYCERCMGQYEIAPGTCYGCGDRPLKAYAISIDR